MSKKVRNCCGGVHEIVSIRKEYNVHQNGRGYFHRILGICTKGQEFVLDHSLKQEEIDKEFEEMQQYFRSNEEMFDCCMVKNLRTR